MERARSTAPSAADALEAATASAPAVSGGESPVGATVGATTAPVGAAALEAPAAGTPDAARDETEDETVQELLDVPPAGAPVAGSSEERILAGYWIVDPGSAKQSQDWIYAGPAPRRPSPVRRAWRPVGVAAGAAALAALLALGLALPGLGEGRSLLEVAIRLPVVAGLLAAAALYAGVAGVRVATWVGLGRGLRLERGGGPPGRPAAGAGGTPSAGGSRGIPGVVAVISAEAAEAPTPNASNPPVTAGTRADHRERPGETESADADDVDDFGDAADATMVFAAPLTPPAEEGTGRAELNDQADGAGRGVGVAEPAAADATTTTGATADLAVPADTTTTPEPAVPADTSGIAEPPVPMVAAPGATAAAGGNEDAALAYEAAAARQAWEGEVEVAPPPGWPDRPLVVAIGDGVSSALRSAEISRLATRTAWHQTFHYLHVLAGGGAAAPPSPAESWEPWLVRPSSWPGPGPGRDRLLVQAISRAFADANAAVIEAGQEHRRRDPSETRPTATTLSLVALDGARYFLVHVGDCSVYHAAASTGEATARQVEHNRAAAYARGDPARYAAARRRRLHNVLTRWVGMTTDWATLSPQVLAPPGALAAGDALVLCSDGLDKHVDPAGVARAALHLPAPAAARRFVALANDRGGSDHIAVAVLQTRPPARPAIWSAAGRALWRETAATAYQRSRTDLARLGIAGLAAAVLASAAAVIATALASPAVPSPNATPTALPTASPLPSPRPE